MAFLFLKYFLRKTGVLCRNKAEKGLLQLGDNISRYFLLIHLAYHNTWHSASPRFYNR